MTASTLHAVRRSIFLLLLLASTMAVAPLGAQDEAVGTSAPAFAPGIGRWAGAPRGQLTNIVPAVDSLVIKGVARDPDSARAVEYELLIDGLLAATGATPRPSGFGLTAPFEESVRVSPGVHRVCLRLLDRQLGNRTVQCRTAVTEPPNQVDALLAASATGVAITPTGVVLPIASRNGNTLQVQTPCGAVTTIPKGDIVERARVVIDPGHGGSESGASSGSLLEKNVNLAVAERVVDKLEKLGISAQLTRTGDYRLPIRSRADIATALAPDVFLSLHHNGGATRRSSRPGTEVFYAQGRSESKRLAAIIYEEMVAAASQFDAQWVSTVSEGASVRLREDGLDLYGIHRYSPGLESVITEFLYLSNRSEGALMRRPDVIDAEAQSIVDGVLRWWFTTDSGTTRGRQFTDSSSSGTGGFDGCVDPVFTLNSTSLASRADTLTVASSEIAAPAPLLSLLPALVLGVDPAVG